MHVNTDMHAHKHTRTHTHTDTHKDRLPSGADNDDDSAMMVTLCVSEQQ